MNHTTTDIRQYFNVTRQTVANWCKEFEEYLSPTATPSNGTHRQLTDDDVKVIALVAEMSGAGRKFDEIHVALRAGQRGELPEITNEGALVPLDVNTQLSVYRGKVLELESKVADLARQRDEAVGQVKLLRELQQETKAEIQDLYRKMARLEAQIERKPVD